jgi:D-3-phosphoglycerate dehydrogenase
MKQILITYQLPKEGLVELESDFKVSYPDQTVLSKDDLLDTIESSEAIITAFGHPLPEEVIRKGKKLQIISNFGAGVDNIPIQVASEQGIIVTNTPDAVTEATAELTLALMLDVARRVSELDRKIRRDEIEWGIMRNLGRTLYGKNLGVIGMGRIGMAVADRAKALGMNIRYYNRHKLDPEKEKQLGASFQDLPLLLSDSDVVSLHVPLTSETHHMIGYEEFQVMKPDTFLINTARGPVVDECAMIRCLKEGCIAGAGLDVFENEPVIPDALRHMEQVVMTPHGGTATIETRIVMAREAARNIIDYFNGRRPKHIVNPEVYRSTADPA